MKHLTCCLLLISSFFILPFKSGAQSKVLFGYIPNSNDFIYPAAAVGTMLQLQRYNAVFYGETHTTHFEPAFKVHLIKHLYEAYGTRDVFMEIGYSEAWLLNRYLATGDTTLFDKPTLAYTNRGGYYRTFWHRLYEFNGSLPEDRRIVIHGVDFERTEVFKVLLMLLPDDARIPPVLQPVFDSIRLYSHDKNLSAFSKEFIGKLHHITAGLTEQHALATQLYGGNMTVVDDILNNKGYQTPRVRGRNRTMSANIAQTVARDSIGRFVGFFGGAHTTYRRAGSVNRAVNRLNNFHGKVVTIQAVNYNVYNNRLQAYQFCTGIGNGKKAHALYRAYLDTPARAALVRDIRGEADYLLLANDTTVVR